jgi:hypothetical protein
MLNLKKQNAACELLENELDLVAGADNGRLVDAVLVGAMRAGAFLVPKCIDGYTPVKTPK